MNIAWLNVFPTDGSKDLSLAGRDAGVEDTIYCRSAKVEVVVVAVSSDRIEVCVST